MSCRKLDVLIVCVCLCLVVPESCSHLLNKCCPEHHQLNATGTTIYCTLSDSTSDHWRQPTTLVSNDTESTQQIVYGKQPSCDTASMDLLVFGKKTPEFALVSDETGGFRLSVLKESTLHDPDVGRTESFPEEDFCLDAIGTLSVALLCPCRTVHCVRKCCHDGHVFDSDKQECVAFEDADEHFFDWVPKVDNHADYYRMVARVPTCERYTAHIVTTTMNESQFLLLEDGSLKEMETGEIFKKDEYCATHTVSNKEMLIFCMKMDSEAATKRIVYGSIFLFGACCLLATVVITAILPSMRRNLQGKMALAHNSMLLIGYLVTGTSQLWGHLLSRSSCEAFSLIIQFTFLAAFFWLNAMCIDIAWTFSGLQPFRDVCLRSERAKLVLYSLYAWGGTAMISISTIIVEYLPDVTRFKPKFGIMMCFFNDPEAELLFFYGPMAVILIVNVLLFVFIACNIFFANNQMKMKCKRNLILYGKLFILMGVTWVTEVISWAVGGPNYFWYVTDVINLLRSVFIFVIFCCKRSIYNQLRIKILHLIGKNVSDFFPSHSTKSCSNDSDKRAVAMAKRLANKDTGSPTETQQQATAGKSENNEAYEMDLKT